MNNTLEMTYEVACCELDELNKKSGNYDPKEIEIMGWLVDIVKDIEEVWKSQDGGASYMRGRSGNYNYGRGRSMMNNGGYSRGDGKEMMLEHLQNVADMATDEKDRKAIERLMSQMSDRQM